MVVKICEAKVRKQFHPKKLLKQYYNVHQIDLKLSIVQLLFNKRVFIGHCIKLSMIHCNRKKKAVSLFLTIKTF